MKKYSVLIVLISASFYSNAQWIQTGNAFFGTIRGMTFISADTGFAVGENGMIAKSVDGGINWSIENSGVSVLLRSVFFLDNSNGYTCGSSGTLINTTDGGNTWSVVYNNPGQYFRGVDFPDSQNGFFAGRAGTVLKTINGGSNWTTHSIGINDADVIQIDMLDINTGYIVCSAADYTHGYVFKTTDGGFTWTQMYSNSNIGLLALAVVDADTVYVGGNQQEIFKTTNGGASWNLVYTGSNASTQFRAAAVRTPSSIAMTDAVNNVITTTDFGNSWTSEVVGDNGLFAIAFADSTLGYTGDGFGDIYKQNYTCALPVAPGPVVGDTLVCFGQQSVYTISPSINADSYLWTMPPGATLISGQGDTIAVIEFDDSLGGIVNVASVSNTCGIGGSSALDVEVGNTLQPTAVYGAGEVCSGAQEVYTTNSVLGADTFEWTVPGDATIISGQGDTSIVVQFGVLSGPVSVTLSGPQCGLGGTASLNVIVSGIPQAGIIDGPLLVCSDDTIQFTTQLVQYADSYQWSVPNDASVISGQGTSNVMIHFGIASGDVSVTVASIACGEGSTSSVGVTVDPAPVTPTQIFGDTSFCSGDTALFWINSTANSDSYSWTIPLNCSIVSGQGDTAVQVLMGTGEGLVKVASANGCGTSAQIQFGFVVHPTPAPVISFTNDTLFSSSPFGNQWYYNDTLIPAANNKFYVPYLEGNYHVIVTSTFGCTAISNTIDVIGLEVTSTNMSSAITIHPNPSSGNTIIDFPWINDAIIRVTDVEGKLALQRKNFSGSEFNIDVSEFAKGIYLVRILNQQSELIGVKKLIVQ